MSDNAKSFTSRMVNEVCLKPNITNKHTLPFNACPNQSERVHRNLGEMLRAINDENQELWDRYIPAINLALNSAKSRATSFSPFFLMFGRSPRIELDVLTNPSSSEVEEDHHVADILIRKCKAFDIVQTQIKKNLDYRIKEYAQEKKEYQIGSHALVFTPTRKVGESSKLKRGWSLPFKITKQINDICYEMESLKWSDKPFKIVR